MIFSTVTYAPFHFSDNIVKTQCVIYVFSSPMFLTH